MGDSDFLHKFHNLEGTTIKDRKKNFYKLLKTPSLFPNEEQLNNALKQLKPQNYQESIFYIDTLLYFKKTDFLLELLKSGNELYTSKILKASWFFEEAFNDYDPEKLVIEYLPCLSYAIKKKFLSRLLSSWKTERIDLLFDALERKYGLTVAIPVLHKCSETKIKAVLDDNEIKLRPNQVIELINKNEELFKVYLSHINKLTNNKYDESKVLSYLAKKNPELYLEIAKDKKIINSPLGRKTTKKFIPLIKQDLLTNSEEYFRFLNHAAAIRKLGNLGHDFEIIYKNVFPNKFGSINTYSTGNRWLRFYPKGRRWNLFINTCTEKFSDKSLDQILLLWSSQIKDLHPPKEIYLKWAEVHYQKQEGNFEQFLQHYEPSVAIPLIKEKINVTKDIYKRGNLIQLMIKSCAEHKDFTALEQVLQYICFRHRNEYPDFRNSLLRDVSNNFKLEDLNENHWKYINEQIKILKIQKEFHFFVNVHFLQRHLEFLFKNKKDYKEALVEYINEGVKETKMRMLDLNNKPVEKEIYIAMGNTFSDALSKESEHFVYYQIRLLTTILTFSVTNPEYCINLVEIPDFLHFLEETFVKQSNNEFGPHQNSLFPKLLTYNLTFPKYAVPLDDSKVLNIISAITKHNKSFSAFNEVYKKCILKKSRTKLENSMLLLYFDEFFELYPDVNIVNWFIKNEPSTVAPYFDKIVKHTVNTHQSLDFPSIRNCSYLKFDQKVCKQYRNKLDDEGIHDKKKLVTALTILLSTDAFNELIQEKYLPQKDKLDLEDKAMVDMYHLQCKIIELSAQVVEPYKMLPTIMKFCRGDYLQSALRALYKTFYRSPEKILYSYVVTLAKMAVSVRKHAIFLSCEVLDKEHTLDLLRNTNESNISSQKHLFSATLKYFLKNPSRDLLQKLIESMSSIDKNDLETLNNLANVTIPSRYRAQYLENCWKYFESLAATGFKINVYLEQLLKKMRGDIAISLSAGFVANVVTNYCFKGSSFGLNNTNDFVIEILKTRESERTHFFTLTFDLLSKSDITLTSDFFNTFFIITNNSIDLSLLSTFSRYWNKYFTIVNFLNEHIELNLRIMQQSKSSPNNYARDIVNYLDKLISEFGFHVYYNFKEVFNNIVNLLEDLEYYSVLLAILKHKLDATTCILVLEVLEVRTSSESELKLYYNIRDLLKNVEIPIVCAYRNNFIREGQF